MTPAAVMSFPNKENPATGRTGAKAAAFPAGIRGSLIAAAHKHMKISNAVESRVVKAWMREMRQDCPDDAMIEFIRRRTYEVAYHEAGHVVARLFTGHEAGHIQIVSIIPGAENLGHVRVNMSISERCLDQYPEFLRQTSGRCLLIDMLAGRVADDRVRPDTEREEIVDFYGEELEMEGSDLFRAARVSSIMARKYMSQDRILRLAEKWTKEMFEIPQVWNACERLAEALLNSGTVRPAKIEKLCGDVCDMAMRLPVWKRRLFLSQKQIEAMTAEMDIKPQHGAHRLKATGIQSPIANHFPDEQLAGDRRNKTKERKRQMKLTNTITVALSNETARGLRKIAKASGESAHEVASYFLSAASHAAYEASEVRHQVENMQATY